MTERPLFVDPAPAVTGGEVGEAPVPRWFVLVAVLVLAVSAYVLVTLIGGPKVSWRHDFESGRDAVPATAGGASSG